ncbi:hypothetical protein EK0264_13125 [Epidermidibacterium keratini]|uniref:DUF559 domain-containing protein n=1 Tax=Epidermidibacterium keratini TaxID=1891644 RepID=A0A7L4YPT5_9ACTN|nr:hypothetical protein [Epidermidibacterium keratini]QHC01140.1 hypothetical protein EK0264_13125 [Epidermidibacterium keratini]
MHPRQEISPARRRIADARGGVVHLDELRADGIGRAALSRLRGTELRELGSSWFALTTVTWRGYVHAAADIAGDDAAAIGSTAAALHGLGEQVLPISFACFGGRAPQARGWVTFTRAKPDLRIVQQGTDPPRIGLEDAVLDVAATARDDVAAIAVITRALQERRTTPERLLARLAARARVRRRDLLEKLLRDAAGLDSALEHAYVRNVEQAHGLPPMERQFVVPETSHHSDGAYADLRTLIELDGVAYHDPDADRELDNLHWGLRYGTFRFKWEDAHAERCRTARTVAAIFGWVGPPKRCPRCPDLP